MRNLFIALLCAFAATAYGQTTSSKEKKTEVADSVNTQASLPPTFQGQPLFLLDGKRVDNIDKINVENLSSVKIISDSTELAAYGEAGKYGVILMQSKNTVPALSTAPVSSKREKEKVN